MCALLRHNDEGSRFRICPVAGCSSVPLKWLQKHLAYAHPQISSSEAARLFRAAAVFHVPAGKVRSQVLVRKKAKLQVAKKSTARRRLIPIKTTGQLEAAVSEQSPGDCSADDSSCSDIASPQLQEEENELQIRMVDRATQCDLLPPGFLESLDRAASTPTSSSTPRAQYARKSTSSNPRTPLSPSSPPPTPGTTQLNIQPGEPCEFMCKWGNWDVIFYETPSFLSAASP